jgi:hypothetical protein
MSKIYVGQDFTLTLDANIALGSATTLEIRYIKPGSSTVVTGKTATPSGTTASADFTNTEMDTNGGWRFFVYAVIDSKILIGETFKKDVRVVGD